MLGHLPAAFYRVDTDTNFNALAIYTPREPEIWVVLGGVLSVKDARLARSTDDYETALIPGQVVKVPPQTIAMKALGSFDTATSMALAIFTTQPDPEGIIIAPGRESRTKETETPKIKLPYLNGQ